MPALGGDTEKHLGVSWRIGDACDFDMLVSSIASGSSPRGTLPPLS
jgi:hypothetical protein